MATAIHAPQTFEHIKQEIEDNIKNTAAENDSTSESIKGNRILSLSGGGIKGIAELMVLIEIEERTGKSISELFPIISGTSVGGLVAALLTIPKELGSKEAKYSAKDALEIFKESSSDIFPNIFLGSIKQIFTHKYSQKPLEELLEKYLGDNRMDSPTSRLVIPVNDLTKNGGELEIFDSLNSYSPHVRVKDVLLATTAAPTYFKAVMDESAVVGYQYASGIPYAYADGGLDANRPANEVLKLLKKDHTREERKEILDKTMVCAFNFSNDIEPMSSIPKIGFDGMLGWLTKGKLISRLMINKEAASTSEVASELSGEDEFVEIRLPITKETSSLDNASLKNIQKLEEIGRKYIEDNNEQLQRLCDNLVKYVEIDTKAITHEKAEDIAAGLGLDLDNSSDDTTIVNKEAITVTSDDIANSNEDAARDTNKSDGDDVTVQAIITNDNREQILDGIKQYLITFAKAAVLRLSKKPWILRA